VTFPVRLLVVEDNPGDEKILLSMLDELGGANYDVTCVNRLAPALEVVRKGFIDLAFLDLHLPDSGRDGTVPAFMEGCPSQTAVVVVSGMDDEELAAIAIQHGAQDYVVKGRFDAFLLGRVMRYAIERQRLQRELRAAMAVLVPTCAVCNRVRDRADNTWHSRAEYLERYAEDRATHGLCPDCRDEQVAKMVEENGKLNKDVRIRKK
jgi:CheY-like chemotaxis protein